jgi:glucokinase
MYRIGIDLGGTNTAAGLVDEAGKILDRESVKTNLPTDLDRIVGDIVSLCRILMNRNGLSGRDIHLVGVGVPCTANVDTGWMEDADHLGFSGGPLRERLQVALQLPVAIGNDADCAAWGEYKSGAYDSDSFLLVTLGTGVGGGIILGGNLITGVNNAAGEIGHMTIHMDGEPCGCGNNGCFEAYGSASALIRHAREATGEPITEAKEVFRRAAAGEQVFIQLLDEYTTHLAVGLSNLINIFGPAYICIGGGVSLAGEALLQPVREKTYDRMFAKAARKKPQIILAKLHNDAGILGAALLKPQKEVNP